MSDDDEQLAETLQARGLHMQLEQGELLAEAVLIAKVVDADGKVYVRWAATDSSDWTSRRALIEIMRDVERFRPGREA